MTSIKIKKIGEKIKALCGRLTSNIFGVLIFLLVLDLFLGVFFFWWYGWRQEIKEGQIPSALALDQARLSNFSDNYSQKEKTRQEADKIEYRNVFQGRVSPIATSTTSTAEIQPATRVESGQ